MLREVEANNIPARIEVGGRLMDSDTKIASNLFVTEDLLGLKSTGFPESLVDFWCRNLNSSIRSG